MSSQKEIEEKILAYWKAHKIYSKVKQKYRGGEKFFFCDGPPYATGQIHPGTAWNKCIKDSVLRYYRARGFNVRDQPGYDTHGLPIEVKVEKELKLKSKKDIEKMGVDKFIDKCKTFATKHISVISNQFISSGVWMDFDNPYITYNNSYINSIWKTIKAAEDKGLLKLGFSVVPQCTRCETSLANYELEYGQKKDPAIFVKFKVKNTANEYIVIWTTTPWTLVANMAVMVHPTFTYIKVQVDDEIWIVAKERLDLIMQLKPDSSFVILSETSGKKLEGLEYIHPLNSRIKNDVSRKIILSDEYVTLDEGSGLVHCAPGHGPEDYIVAKRFSIDVFSPVDTKGEYTKEAGVYAGLSVFEVNDKIISDLDELGALVSKSEITHRYPHCWRCKTPLIYITTNQWFISVSKLKDKMLSEVDNSISFHPDFAKTRFRDFVSSAPDWCISRQRYWGTPLPIWVCEDEKCGKRKVLGSKDELPDPSIDLHKPFIDVVEFKCECGKKMKRVPDILDVWFDSGNSVWAQMGESEDWSQNHSLQCDFIVEGKDQTRGWFYSLLGSGVLLNNETPYKNLTMTGFFVTETGEKMSKSVGNFVPLEQILSKYGADAFRLWSLSATVWDDLKFNTKDLDESKRALDIFKNIGIWMNRFYVHTDSVIDEKKLEIEDKWILSRLQSVIKITTTSFDNFQPHDGLVALKHFIIEDISRFYLKRLKQRINDEKNAQVGLQVLYNVFLTSIELLTPYTPFVAEHLYLSIFKEHVKEESISLLPWPEVQTRNTNALLEQQMVYLKEIINSSANARAKANIKLRWPVAELKISSDSTEVKNAVERAKSFLCKMTNSQKVSLGTPRSKFELEIHKNEVGAKFKQDSPLVLKALLKLKPKEVIDAFSKEKKMIVDKKYEIDESIVSINEIASGYKITEFNGGKVYVNTIIDKDLYAIAIEREIARRIQSMRKELSLVQTDSIQVWIAGDKDILSIAKTGKENLQKSVNSVDIHTKAIPKEVDLLKDWKIEEFNLKIAIKKVN